METTALGLQYPDESDAVTNYPAVAAQVAQWVDARPGIARLTTAQRNALTAPDLWNGKVIYNLTTFKLQIYDAANGGWRDVVGYFNVLPPTGVAATDTANIAATVAAAGAAGGGIVLLQAGVYVTTGLTLNAWGVTLRGVNEWAMWSNLVGGTVLQCASAIANPIISVTANNCSVEGIAFGTTGGTTTQDAVYFNGVTNFAMRRLFATNVGAFHVNNSSRGVAEECVNQAFPSLYGFELNTVTICALRKCNSAAATVGTAGFQNADVYMTNCESIEFNNFQCNNTPWYGVYASNCNDCEAYDLELNGAASAQMYLTGCKDWQFTHTYVWQPAPSDVVLNGGSYFRFHGGIMGITGNGVVMQSGVSQVIVNGVQFSAQANNCKMVVVNDTSDHVTIVNNNLDAGAYTGCIGVQDNGTGSARQITIVGNDFSPGGVSGETSTFPNKVQITGTTSTDMRIRDNAGLNPVGWITSPAFPGSDVGLVNRSGYDCMVYVVSGSSSTRINSSPTLGTQGSFYLPNGQNIEISGSAVTWEWYAL